ncbi:hypothetical protein CFBP5875_04705 [Agrobacterium pusense]|uniref:DUF5675 family protein n=1 Tax=Agrobacterium pusense TaxID=648995 RepID=UPI0010BF3281|nr:DUF5675 family protein [Agrobacterium pusense]QCL83919.1 hypothetical protein CFBP5875_04705 [Agrobacterium pusense]
MELRLERKIAANNAVIGVLTGLSVPIYTLEDAWRNNAPNVSCIPPATYKVKPHGWEENTPFKYKRVWQLQNVPGRSAILIHSGNKHQDTQGCILVGLGLQISQTQSMVNDSKLALEILRKEIGERFFTIVIA